MTKLFIFVAWFSTSVLHAQHLYLNGTEITGATTQNLKQVDIHIDDQGHIHISAPHYTVVEQASYLPIGDYKGKHPDHQAPQALQKKAASPKQDMLKDDVSSQHQAPMDEEQDTEIPPDTESSLQEPEEELGHVTITEPATDSV